MTIEELKSKLTEKLLAMLPKNMAQDVTRENAMANLAEALAEPIDEAVLDVQSYDWKGMASVAEICTMQEPQRGDVWGVTDGGTIVWPGAEPMEVAKGDIVVYNGSEWKMFLHIDPAVVDCYTKAETDERIATAVNAEASARQTADNALSAAITAEATARANADTALGERIDAEASARESADDALDARIDAEETVREQADGELQAQIDAISSRSDVVDVVASHVELVAYDTSTLADNDVVKVLADETHEDAIAYYRWSTTTEAWSFIGSQGPYYTISETDTLLAGRAPTNHASTATTYGVGDANKYGHVKVDSALSSTSTNPVQNKVVKAVLDGKAGLTANNKFTGENWLENITRFSTSTGIGHLIRVFPEVSYGAGYSTWPEEYKDGNHFREWALRFPSGVNFWGKIRITLGTSYASYNASGVMQKSMNVSFDGSTIYNNGGYYNDLGIHTEEEFRISELVWNYSENCWEIRFHSIKPTSSNSLYFVIVEFFTWRSDYANLIDDIYFLDNKAYITTDTSYTKGGGGSVSWATQPVFQTPYGNEVFDLSKTLPIANGGTGKTNANDAANALINGLPLWSADVTDNTQIIRQDNAGSATFGRVPGSAMWNYIKGKVKTWLGVDSNDKIADSHIASASTWNSKANADGSNATGTWDIDITGNSASATNAKELKQRGAFTTSNSNYTRYYKIATLKKNDSNDTTRLMIRGYFGNYSGTCVFFDLRISSRALSMVGTVNYNGSWKEYGDLYLVLNTSGNYELWLYTNNTYAMYGFEVSANDGGSTFDYVNSSTYETALPSGYRIVKKLSDIRQNYYGNADTATNATYAEKIGSSSSHQQIGSVSNPVYVASDGTITPCDFYVG